MEKTKSRFSLSQLCHPAQVILTGCFIMACITTHAQKKVWTGADPETKDDYTYGNTGKKKMTLSIEKDSLGVIIRTRTDTLIYDPAGKYRESHYAVVRSDGSRQEDHFYYDCKENLISRLVLDHDLLGNEIHRREEKYKDGKQNSGFVRDIDSTGKKTNKNFNPKTNKWEDVDFTPLSNEIGNFEPDKNSCPVNYITNGIFIGPSVILEDSKPKHFYTWGGQLDFTHLFSNQIGLTGDLGFNVGSNQGVNYTKLTALGGIIVDPIKNASEGQKFKFSVHALAGYSSLKESFSFNNFKYDTTISSFTFDLGGAFAIKLSENIDLRVIQVDYIHTGFNNAGQNDFRVSAGVGVVFKKKHEKLTTTNYPIDLLTDDREKPPPIKPVTTDKPKVPPPVIPSTVDTPVHPVNTVNTPQACNISVKEKVEPQMDGGLKEKCRGNKKILRDDFIPLSAEGRDYDELIWVCEPGKDCKESRSEKHIPLNGRVRFEWDIIQGEGNFVKLGCLPDSLVKDEGDNVIFKPPYVPLPVKASDTSFTTIVALSIIDDNPTQPRDTTVKKKILIKTTRSKADPDHYLINISGGNYYLPSAPATKPLEGTCKTVGPTWTRDKDLTLPVILLPGVPDNNKMAIGEWMVLHSNDQRDPDEVELQCASSSCNGSVFKKIYEDNVGWEWYILKGGGHFIGDPLGRFVIYEAPMELPKGIDFVDVTIGVVVKNPNKLKIADIVPDTGKITIRVYQAGVKLSQPPLAWLPEENNNLEFTDSLMYKDGSWKPSLAHMCRIHFFELLNVSQEPGKSLNSPARKNSDQCRDLQLKNESRHEAFDDSILNKSQCKMEKLFVQARTQSPKKVYKLTVYSLDYGSYGFLRTFANIHKKGDAGAKGEKPYYIPIPVLDKDVKHPLGRKKKTIYEDNRVTIPYDVDENHICDNGWMAFGGVHVDDPIENDSDEDRRPIGDKFLGDGLTNYEEYRGFHVINPTVTHIRTNPEVKDIFIRNENNLPLDLYTSITELDVHQIADSQYIDRDTRCINYNFNPLTHLVDQFGIRLVNKGNSSTYLGIAISEDNPQTINPPNWEHEVDVFRTTVDSYSKTRGLNAAGKLKQVVAHELCHANNIYHHGLGDPDLEKKSDAFNGLRSGNTACVMRYDNVGDKVVKQPEGIGSLLCTKPDGTGYNANGKGFGDAMNGRGNCKGQLRISGRDPKYPKR
jgi:hypothetical protein